MTQIFLSLELLILVISIALNIGLYPPVPTYHYYQKTPRHTRNVP